MAKTKKNRTRARANGTGSLWTDPKNGSLYGVITWFDAAGKPKRRTRRSVSGTKKEAYDHIKDLLAELEKERRQTGAGPTQSVAGFNPSTLTWEKLGAWFQRHYLGVAVLNSERKLISGCLSWKPSRRQLHALVQRLGPSNLVRDLTTEDLIAFKAARLQEPVITVRNKRDPITNRVLKNAAGKNIKESFERERQIAGPHRELAMIRQLLKHAFQNEWIPKNPWRPKLIEPGAENMRDTIATQKAETTLLEQCTDHKKRRHLWLYLTVMFDSACRSAELRRLLVSDCDFKLDQFTVFSFKGGKRRERQIPMTPRARVALLSAAVDKAPGDHVFTYDIKRKHDDGSTFIERRPLKSAPSTSWNTARRLAKFWSDGEVNLDNFRGHDARHTAITRAVNSNKMAAENIMKITGHTQSKTFMRYVNPDHAERSKFADVLANHHEADVVQFTAKKQTAKGKRKSAAA